MQDMTPISLIKGIYDKIQLNIQKFQEYDSKPLTLAEKLFIGHLSEPKFDSLTPGRDYIFIKPDRVALQDASGQMVLLQFMQSKLSKVLVPTTLHCDHLIQAKVSASSDIKRALFENNEVYKFLESASKKFGIGFWKPGAGIIHQVLLENYAFPGGLIIGTDSHTPNSGGLGMMGIGVGGIDASEVMAGFNWEILYPERIGVYLTGELNGWTSPKDVILYLTSILTVSGATNCIIEYFGPGTKSISCTGKATITNMGAEIGATSSIFPLDETMINYLNHTNRKSISNLINKYYNLFTIDKEIENNPTKYFKRVIEINLSDLEPYVVGPHTPDLARPISQLADDVRTNDYIDEISVGLIGSCTNSSYEDMGRVSSIALQAVDKNIKTSVPLLITPGSEQIRATIERDGQLYNLESIGATVLANACGPCIGQWNRPEIKNQKNTILTSFNRNFPGRNDGSRETMSFMASPEIVVALSLAGRLSFNPTKDYLIATDGSKFKLKPPPPVSDIPKNGFVWSSDLYIPPQSNKSEFEILIAKNSKRLQVLDQFDSWNSKNYSNLIILGKIKGKCTTDHISPAGSWLKFRGHLDNISDNLLIGAANSFHNSIGMGKNQITGNIEAFSSIARYYKKNKISWMIIGEDNYGEGSSREHAAMSPRYLGCTVVIAKSFARIHETNLKKQGILTLTFVNENDYDVIQENDLIDILDLEHFSENQNLEAIVKHQDKTHEKLLLKHTYTKSQINWFKEGSALNVLRKQISQ